MITTIGARTNMVRLILCFSSASAHLRLRKFIELLENLVYGRQSFNTEPRDTGLESLSCFHTELFSKLERGTSGGGLSRPAGDDTHIADLHRQPDTVDAGIPLLAHHLERGRRALGNPPQL